MSREGGHGRIDSLKNALNTEQYHRTGLGNAVRFNAALNLASEEDSEGNRRFLSGGSREEFLRAFNTDIESIREEFDEILNEEFEDRDSRLDNSETIEQRKANAAYRTRLGRSVARATVENLGMYQDENSPFNSGATGAFRSFTNGFVQDDEDAFGSRVLYDNVFGQYEDGGESLTMLHRRTVTDPNNHMNRTVGEKVLDDVVNRSIYDQNEIITRVDTEFARFHGDSMVDQFSMTGSGLRAARQTIRDVMLESSAYGRQLADRGEDAHPVEFAQALINRAGSENVSAEVSEIQTSLTLLDNNLKNRSGQSAGIDGGYVNKAGVAQFIDLINTAGTRSDNGELIGGHIAISSFQFQNETVSAALTDKIQRHVLESVLQGGTGKPLQVDLTLAYPRQRNLNQKNSEDTRYGIGATNYSILGPNLIEALKLEEIKNDVFDMLRGMGVVEDDLQNYLNVNIQFRDKKFHPKVYLTDNVAGIGTQNLTGPVGNSVNQAGSNFETMRFVANKYNDDTQLNKERSSFVPSARDELTQRSDNALKNSDITQSLLYRQIVNAVEYEQNYTSQGKLDRTGGGTAAPILNNRRGNQIGFAGDIYEHMRNTLNYAYETNFNIVNGSQAGAIRKNVAGTNSTHMFMVLDQAFILQMGSDSFSKQLKGEMGNEVGSPFGEKDDAVTQYRAQQSKLFDLLIANKASVVVDAKNYQKQVMNPLIEKINKNEQLKSNFERHGKSLGLMAGYDLFDPGSASTPEEYSLAMKAMRRNLVDLGFTKEAGFNDSDLKQLIGLASGNIEMAKAPRQHVKSFGLMDYRQGGSPELISYYMGSSNLGLYSLGIPTGDNGGFKSTDGDLTNTEMGIMLGRRDMADGTNLSRVNEQSARMSNGHLSDPTSLNGVDRVDSSAIDQWSLTQEEERHELMLAQRHLIQTWSQLGNSRMDNPNFKAVNTTPLWQQNVNTGDLQILKNRLETMARDLGIDPNAARSSFQIVERYGDTSGSGLTSINVTIDMAQMLGTSGFLASTQSLPKLNFELTVLQGPSRGSGMFNDRTDDGTVPGFVYFVDKNKVVGNGLFTNDSGHSLQVLGRHNYDDDFVSDIDKGGRITLETGQSAEMTSLDIVPQLFASIIGEGVKRFGTEASVAALSDLNDSDRRKVVTDYLSKRLSGRADQLDEDTGEIFTSRQLLLKDLNETNIHDLIAKVGIDATSAEGRADFRESGDSFLERQTNRDTEQRALHKYTGQLLDTFRTIRDEGREIEDRDLDKIITSTMSLIYGDQLDEERYFEGSDQLANQVMRLAGRNKDEAQNIQEFKEFQTLMFGSFLQSRDDRTYGGQQGFYRTLLFGVGDTTIDRKTANLMFELDEQNQGLHNLGAYARFKPLEYTPTTDIHQVLYRSVASKSTSMSKNDPGLDSMMFESEARDLGDAANLRLMSSIGIGTVMHRDSYIKAERDSSGAVIKDSDGNVMVASYGDQQAVWDSMEAAGVDKNALLKAKQEYVRAVSKSFGDLDSDTRSDSVRLQFYTGSAKKLSQLPQRIKNAMGARPLYQYSVEAQLALAEGESINDITNEYLTRNRDPLRKSINNKVQTLLDQIEDLQRNGGTEEQIKALRDKRLDLITIGSKAFATSTDGLGAVFSGQIKSVLNQEQISFIENTKTRLYNAMADLIEEGEVSEEQFNELIRVEVMKAGLVNKGLGKMIAGSNHMNYSMSIIQLTGTYNDTFLANSLYGSTYKTKAAYDLIQKNEVDIYSLNQNELRQAGVLNVGMTEGYFETQQKSVKGSMMGEGGMNVLLQTGDIIVEDPETGYFVQKRKVEGEWRIVNAVDSNRNLQTIGNIIDNTGFSDVGSPTLGSAPTTTYGRRGEESVDYIYNVGDRAGNFANNEYLLQFDRLRSIKPGSGRRVEGTDSSSLVKGVAFFSGRNKYVDPDGTEHYRNTFEDIERQYLESYAIGEVGGSLKAYIDNADQTQLVTLNDGSKAYAPLSSSIQGVFNSNNFKSFFWSHGATMLRAQTESDTGKSHFMLDELFSTKAGHNVTKAKKLAGALLLTFGTDFVATSSTDTVGKNTEITKVKRALVEGMLRGEYGEHYRKLAFTSGLHLKTSELNNIQDRVDKTGADKADITTEALFNKITKNTGFNGMTLSGLSGISSDQLMAVLSGDAREADQLLNMVRKGMLDPVARSASQTGGINFDNHTHRGAALVTTAVDLMHQLSRSGSQLQLASDIDLSSEKVKEALFVQLGLGADVDEETKNDIVQAIDTFNTDISAVTVFTDITFSFSKDPVGTQSVGRHEAQHLITPFTGNLEKYREGGQLDKIQHTVAGLQALLTGKKSGLVFHDTIARSGFAQKRALNLASEETDFMFTTFHKEKFLGFYQQGTAGISTNNYVKAYKDINRELARGESKYNWEGFQVTRDISDATQIRTVRQGGNLLSDIGAVDEALTVINKHIDQFHPDIDPTQRARLQDKYLRMGGQQFALLQMDELVNQMSIHNARFQADPTKTIGKDTTSQFLQGMQNKQLFVSIPDLEFSQQNGEIIARTDRRNTISTIIPSADDMRALGAQYADFVDPILGHYKHLSSIFVPGTEENRIFEKVRLATQNNQAIVLSTAEFKVYKRIQDSASLMPTELAKGIAGARTQEAFAGKNKYQGFTSTAIGSLLMPFGSAALAQAKLDEAGMRDNKARSEAIKETDRNLQQMNQHLQRRFTDQERIYIALEEKFGAPGKHNNGDFQRALQQTKHWNDRQKMKGLGTLQSTMGSLYRLRKQGYAAQRHNLSKKAQAGNIVSTLNELQRLHDQLDRIKNSELESEATRQTINQLQEDVVHYKNLVFQEGEANFGLRAYTASDIMSGQAPDWMGQKNLGVYNAKSEYITLEHGDKARVGVYGVYDPNTGRVQRAGDFTGEDALPILQIHKQTTIGYAFQDDEDNEVVLQRAGFQAKYLGRNQNLPDYQSSDSDTDKATRRPFDLATTNKPTQTHYMGLEERSRASRVENIAMQELEGKFPGDLQQKSRRKRDILKLIERRIHSTEDSNKLKTISDYLGNLVERREDINVDKVRALQNTIDVKRSSFSQEERFGPSLPSPILSTIDNDPRADLTRDVNRPAAWETISDERNNFIKDTRALILRTDNLNDLDKLADTLDSRLDNLRPELRSPIENILNNDIPNAFDRISNDIWLNTEVDPYPKGFFTPTIETTTQFLPEGRKTSFSYGEQIGPIFDPWLDTKVKTVSTSLNVESQQEYSQRLLAPALFDPWLDTVVRPYPKGQFEVDTPSIFKPQKLLTAGEIAFSYGEEIGPQPPVVIPKFKSTTNTIEGLEYQTRKDIEADTRVLGMKSEFAEAYLNTTPWARPTVTDSVNVKKSFKAAASVPSKDGADFINNKSQALVNALGYTKISEKKQGIAGFVRRSTKEIPYKINNIHTLGTFVHEFTHAVQDRLGLPVFGSVDMYDKLNPMRNSLSDYNDRYKNLMEWQAYSVGEFVRKFQIPEFRAQAGISAMQWTEQLIEAYSSGDQKTILDFAEKWGFTNVIPDDLRDYIPSDYEEGKVYSFNPTLNSKFEGYNAVPRSINEDISVVSSFTKSKLPSFSERYKNEKVLEILRRKAAANPQAAEKLSKFAFDEIYGKTYDQRTLRKVQQFQQDMDRYDAELEELKNITDLDFELDPQKTVMQSSIEETLETARSFKGGFLADNDFKQQVFYLNYALESGLNVADTYNDMEFIRLYEGYYKAQQDSDAKYPGLTEYAGIKYKQINKYRRGQISVDSSASASLIADFDMITNELNSLENKDLSSPLRTTFRGRRSQVGNKLSVGQVIEDSTVSSSSFDKNIALEFAGEGTGTLFYIEGRGGADLNSVGAGIEDEKELLFKAGAKFEVVSIDTTSEKYHQVYLREMNLAGAEGEESTAVAKARSLKNRLIEAPEYNATSSKDMKSVFTNVVQATVNIERFGQDFYANETQDFLYELQNNKNRIGSLFNTVNQRVSDYRKSGVSEDLLGKVTDWQHLINSKLDLELTDDNIKILQALEVSLVRGSEIRMHKDNKNLISAAKRALTSFKQSDSSDIMSMLSLTRESRFNTENDISLSNVKQIVDDFSSLTQSGYKSGLTLDLKTEQSNRLSASNLGWNTSNPFLNAITPTDINDSDLADTTIKLTNIEKTSLEALDIIRNIKPDFITSMSPEYLDFYAKAAIEAGVDGESLKNDLGFLYKFQENYNKQYSGNQDEFAGLLRYTSNASYYEMNKFRRGELGIQESVGGAISDFDRMAGDIERMDAVGKMTTFRGIPVRIAEDLSVGQVLKDQAVSSTSKSIEVGKNFAQGKGTLFIIEGESGRDLSSFSDFDNEDEVLFKPNAEFEVVKIDSDSEKYQQVYLREIAEGGAAKEDSAALEVARRTLATMSSLPDFVAPTISDEGPSELQRLQEDIEKFGLKTGETETEEFLTRLSDNKSKVKKLRRQIKKYRKKVLSEDVDVERKRRKTKEDWQYLVRSLLDLDDSKESSFIAKTIESRILTGSDIKMPSKYSDLQTRAEDLYSTFESDNKDIIDLFRKVRLNSQNEIVDITVDELIDTANRFEDLRGDSSVVFELEDQTSRMGYSDVSIDAEFILSSLTEYSVYHKDVNDMLRGKGGDSYLQDLSRYISQDLTYLPNYQKSSYRGVGADFNVPLRKGGIFSEPAFMSASKKKVVGESYAAGGTLFEVVSGTGKDISSYSKFSAEAEVLFDKGSQFEILDIRDADIAKEGYSRHVVMRQVTDTEARAIKSRPIKSRPIQTPRAKTIYSPVYTENNIGESYISYKTEIGGKQIEFKGLTYEKEGLRSAIVDFEVAGSFDYDDSMSKRDKLKAVKWIKGAYADFKKVYKPEYVKANVYNEDFEGDKRAKNYRKAGFEIKGKGYTRIAEKYYIYEEVDKKSHLQSEPEITNPSFKPGEALEYYVSSGYREINPFYRENTIPDWMNKDELLDITKNLEADLKNQPIFEGKTYRGVSFDPNLKIGEVYSDKAPMSTSINYSTAENFASRNTEVSQRTVFTIKGQSGRELSNIENVIQSEREVLYPASSKFEVVDIRFDEGTQIKHYSLREVVNSKTQDSTNLIPETVQANRTILESNKKVEKVVENVSSDSDIDRQVQSELDQMMQRIDQGGSSENDGGTLGKLSLILLEAGVPLSNLNASEVLAMDDHGTLLPSVIRKYGKELKGKISDEYFEKERRDLANAKSTLENPDTPEALRITLEREVSEITKGLINAGESLESSITPRTSFDSGDGGNKIPPTRPTSVSPEPPEQPRKITNPTTINDPSTPAYVDNSRTRAEQVVNQTWAQRYILESNVLQERRSLIDNVKAFRRKQKAAISLGISKGLEAEFDSMKLEAIETKNKIAKYRESNFLSEDEKRAAFNELKAELQQKRDAAYELANISPDTGREMGIDPETGEVTKIGFDQRRPSLNDSYIYHAQALNYDQLVTHLMLLGNATGVEELSKEHVKDLQKRSSFIRKYGSFALNSYEDAGGQSTFFGLSNQEVGFNTKTLFVIENSDPDSGTVERHMKAITEITEEANKMGMNEASKTMAAQYAKQQIDAQIEMYENRAAEMRKFSQEREAHSGKRDSQGNLIIDEATTNKINAAHQDYDRNTAEIVDFLKQQKQKIDDGANRGQIRTVFEDIDVKVAEIDRANLQMAEVFRPPTPGGTDPRLHTYRVMQGVMALNQVSSMLQETDTQGTGMIGKNTKQIYSTERGQTATIMASLGIVTYGGGDWDGDSYTAIFHQAEDIQKAIQKYESDKSRNKLLADNAEKQANQVRRELQGLDPSSNEFMVKSQELTRLEKSAEERRKNYRKADEEFKSAKQDMELKIQEGYRGLTARARRQVSNYTGIDERHFVSNEDQMYDVNGKAIYDSKGNAVMGLRQGATQDADALFVYMEQGYQLMEKLDSKGGAIIGMMNNIDALTGYRSNPKAFDDDGFLNQLAAEFRQSKGNEITTEHPGIAMLKDRATNVLNENQNLDDNQRAFLVSLSNSDDNVARSYLEEFNKLTSEMGMQESDVDRHNQSQVEYIRDAKGRRARMNKWIAKDLFNPMLANETVGKFMMQGVGMDLTEGTFDMTLKALGKAGGEVLGKTYNTIIGSTFQDAPIITYGTQITDETSDLYHATLTEFQKQAERRFETTEMSPRKAQIIDDGKEKGLTGKKLDNYVATQIRKVGYDEFKSYRDQTMAAVEKSGDVQGFMKNIHQLMRDSIKLKNDGDIRDELDTMSERYDELSSKMSATSDEGERLELRSQRDRIIEGMASSLGPGPGLKSLIDLDYLTNESDKTGITRTDFEERFFEGAIEENRDRLLSMGASMNLSQAEMNEIRGLDSGRNDESAALLKIARGQTARNLGAMVTSYQMARVAGDGRSQQIKDLANTHKAMIASQVERHTIEDVPINRTANGQIDVVDVIDNKYTRTIEREREGARYDAFRQHKQALGAHMGLKESQIFNDDGQLTNEYMNAITKSADDMGVSNEEYLLAYDHLLENNRETIGGLFGNDGEKMEQFTTMNLMRKNVAQAFLTGRTPGEEGSKVINDSFGAEVLTTSAQLAAQGKLDSKGMEIFSGMYKGVMRHLIEATGQKIDVYNPVTGKMEERQYNNLDEKSKQAVLTKLMYENMIGTQVPNEKGFTRATNEEARKFKSQTGKFIANSKLEVRVDEHGNETLGNDFIDALDKAGQGSSTESQKEMYEAMGEEYLRETLNSEEMSEMVLKQYLNADGVDPNSKKAETYRKQIAATTKAQMKARQERITNNTALSRSRHRRGYGVQSRSSFMNNMNSDVIGQLTKDSRANALDLVMPLLLTAAGTAMGEGNITGDDLMALGGAAFTSFQYARTGVIDHGDMSAAESKKRLAAAQATSGIFKLKNAMSQHGEDNFGAAMAQVAVSEAVSVGFNMVATPWLSNKVANGLGAGSAPAMNAMDMRKYQAGHQLAGNVAASAISAISSTLISGVLLNTMHGNGPSLSETIQSFMPAAQAVSQVNEAIARRRAQEAAFEDFQAETDGTDDTIQEYMVVTDATYNPNDYSSIADLAAAQEVEPGSDGSLSVGLLS